eukprot:gene4259-20454_t
MAKQMELFCESIMRGYHAYINVRKVGIGEIMFCEIEGDNEDDDNVIAIKTKDNAIVGHVPEELLSLFYKFLEKHGEVEGDCISCRFNKDARKGVSEVLSKEKCRLSVSGWFYGESIPRPPTYIQERKLPEVGKKLEDEILLKWINPMYLDSEIVDAIQNQLEENSEIQLDDFLLEERYMEVLRELESSENEWKMNGPANKRKYETIEYDDKLSPNLKSLVDLMHSEPMFKLLTKLTGLNLAVLDADNNKESVSGTSSKADQEKASAPSCCSEVRRWARGSYTLMHDSDPALKEFALDAMLFFRCDNWDPSFGGFTSYIADSEDEELLTICPTSNCLTLVYRDKETVRFVKHINASCKDAWDEQKVEVNDFFGFYDLSTVYYE